MSTTFEVELPIGMSENEARALFAIKLYEVGKVSLGQAAKMAGFSKRSFMDVLGQHKIAVLNYPADELSQEIGP